jgi:hypothetical protein
MNAFRMEILFWGLRELQRPPLFPMTKLRVTMECGGFESECTATENLKENPNFENPVRRLNVVSTATYLLNFENLKLLAGEERNHAAFWNIQNFQYPSSRYYICLH